jgi:hypothetical protein
MRVPDRAGPHTIPTCLALCCSFHQETTARESGLSQVVLCQLLGKLTEIGIVCALSLEVLPHPALYLPCDSVGFDPLFKMWRAMPLLWRLRALLAQ